MLKRRPMRIPNAKNAIIAPEKLRDYLYPR